jgi:hypothetical protein
MAAAPMPTEASFIKFLLDKSLFFLSTRFILLTPSSISMLF